MGLEELIINLEGYRNYVYNDSAGHPTIGVGHKLTKEEIVSNRIYINGKMVDFTNGINDNDVKALLRQDLKRYEDAVFNNVDVMITHNQQNALISFCYNVGINAFLGSKLLKKLNTGKYKRVPYELMKWIKITKNGKKIIDSGLINRRLKEVIYWLTGDI